VNNATGRSARFAKCHEGHAPESTELPKGQDCRVSSAPYRAQRSHSCFVARHLGRWLVVGARADWFLWPHMHNSVSLLTQLRKELRHCACGGSVNVMQQNDASSTTLQAGHHPCEDALRVSCPPVERINPPVVSISTIRETPSAPGGHAASAPIRCVSANNPNAANSHVRQICA
jgi:hypothetical protein